MDFGKFLYERTKKERDARRAQTKIEVKEIRLRPKTNIYHQGFKVRDARRWLDDGNKVRVRIRFRGREIDYVNLALKSWLTWQRSKCHLQWKDAVCCWC
jgi:translation initiation factor IF-3